MLASVAELNYDVYMMDVQTAFLNADVDEDFFVKVTPGYEHSNKTGVPLGMRHQKSFYGLHQSPKNCFGTMD